MSNNLNPTKALIFRIVHRDNVPWILEHGLHCRNSGTFDANYRNIGSAELIDKRSRRVVPIPPGGTLSDYVPFYFTPFSIMMLNIKTGHGGVTKVPNEEIVIFVSSLPTLAAQGLPFVFTDRHAYLQQAQFSSDMADLNRIDWAILQNRDFKNDPNDLGKKERYQAEALVHRFVPVDALLGIACLNKSVESMLQAALAERQLQLRTVVQPNWYF